MVNVTVFYVGSSLLGVLRRAERGINTKHNFGLRIQTHNCTLPLSDDQWQQARADLSAADVVFVIHVTDAENAVRIGAALQEFRVRHHGVIVINCVADLMRRTRLGQLDFASIFSRPAQPGNQPVALRIARRLGLRLKRKAGSSQRHGDYLKLATHLPRILRFVPSSGKLGAVRHYLTLVCYFLQPTPANVQSMVLYAIRHCVPGRGDIETPAPESRPATGIYHPQAGSLFRSFEAYRKWYETRRGAPRLDPAHTIGLLLMRPNIVSRATQHYDTLIAMLEAEGLPAIPAISTFMDNRSAAAEFFRDSQGTSRVSQIVSLTGFSFVGGPAMNDSKAAVEFLSSLGRPLRSAVSLEVQPLEHWNESGVGLNPVQSAMQVAIPEVDGATEPFVFGGLRAGSDQPEPLEDRCYRIARRLVRWNRLRTLPKHEVRLAFLIYCFPPNRGNLGTAADLDVFASLVVTLRRLQAEGYTIPAPPDAEALRELVAGADWRQGAADVARVAYKLDTDEYRCLCPYIEDIETEWGPAPGRINARGRDILIHGVELGNAFIGVQPGFGYEGDPMRLLMAKSGAPHHGFMGMYIFLDKIFRADAVVHVGTHGALEFMPGKQTGLSNRCWPDRLIGELPNLYMYSVNNPSEGSIAKRRSYAELISYLTPPVQNAGLYKELAAMKDLIGAYRQAADERHRDQLVAAIEEQARALNML
jgi:magnesium chelatase subunit H